MVLIQSLFEYVIYLVEQLEFAEMCIPVHPTTVHLNKGCTMNRCLW